MKILYIAFACDPCAGSEAQCGWAWAYSMRKNADVYLITRKQNKHSIDSYMKENEINDITVFYHDIPSVINLYYKTGKAYHLYYKLWLETLGRAVKQLHNKYHFDVVHQVTLGDFRMVAPMKINDTKFIFGPVGGAQLTPKVFYPYVLKNIKKEKVREFINRFTLINPIYRNRLNKAKLVFSANKETYRFMSQIMVFPERCHLLTENGVIAEKLTDISKKHNDCVKLLWAGRMVNRKGLEFLLETISIIKTEIPYELSLVGTGEELAYLENKAKQLGIIDNVRFLGKLSYEEMTNIYQRSDIFVFPSLRETTGTVLFEAMSHGIPIVTFAQNGADLLIDEQCGIKVGIDDRSLNEIREDYALALEKLISDAEYRIELGIAARRKIEEQYLWENKCQQFYMNYLEEE